MSQERDDIIGRQNLDRALRVEPAGGKQRFFPRGRTNQQIADDARRGIFGRTTTIPNGTDPVGRSLNSAPGAVYDIQDYLKKKDATAVPSAKEGKDEH